METVKGDGNLLLEIDLNPENIHKEVLQNVAIILDTIRNTVPMMRGLGIPGEYMGRPTNVVKNEIISEIYDQLEEYEPRAIIAGVSIQTDYERGQLIPTVEIEGVREDG